MPNRAGCIKIKFPYCITHSVAGFLVTGVMNIGALQLNKCQNIIPYNRCWFHQV